MSRWTDFLQRFYGDAHEGDRQRWLAILGLNRQLAGADSRTKVLTVLVDEAVRLFGAERISNIMEKMGQSYLCKPSSRGINALHGRASDICLQKQAQAGKPTPLRVHNARGEGRWRGISFYPIPSPYSLTLLPFHLARYCPVC